MPKKPRPISETLRAAVKASKLTHYAVAKLSNVSPRQIDRFMSGERDLTLNTAAAIAAALGLELVRA